MASLPQISTLDQLYYYQNRTSGQASTTPVSIRQLCKILSNKTTHVTPDTLAWSSSLPGNKWIELHQIPILKECCADWFYTLQNQSATLGPVGVKQLHSIEHDISMVYSPQFDDKGWSPIAQYPDLALAIRAFDQHSSIIDPNARPKEFINGSSDAIKNDSDDVQQELEAFLRSADPSGTTADGRDSIEEEEEEGESYESDGGTTYIKDAVSGKWIHEALVPKKTTTSSNPAVSKTLTAEQQGDQQSPLDLRNKKKRSRAKFSARNAKCWVYVSGLPLDTNEEELQRVFSKAGILDLDPETQKPKVKLYSTTEGRERVLKGDASLCYARPESVDLCIQLFHEAPFRLEQPKSIISVERARFEQRGDLYQKKAQSRQKRLVAKKAALQSIGWEANEENGRITGGLKGLTIIVLEHMFTPDKASDDAFLEDLERKIRNECSEWGTVTKITIFASNPKGIILVRFKEPTAATTAIEQFNGRMFGGMKVEAHFWDGVTDYAVKDMDNEQKVEEARLEEFGDWLDNQTELPDELQLQVEQ